MFRKFATTAVLVAGLSSAAIVSATAPAAAMSDGAAAAIGVGAFAVGAMAASMSGGYHGHHVVYHDCYYTNRPVYNPWGRLVAFQRVRYCD